MFRRRQTLRRVQEGFFLLVPGIAYENNTIENFLHVTEKNKTTELKVYPSAYLMGG